MWSLELNRYPLHAYSKNSSAVPHSHPSKQVVMSSTEWAQAALQSFDAVVSATEGFRSRQMIGDAPNEEMTIGARHR